MFITFKAKIYVIECILSLRDKNGIIVNANNYCQSLNWQGQFCKCWKVLIVRDYWKSI